MPADPIARVRRWYREAERRRLPLPEAMALATADARGRPTVRVVLMKQLDRRGLVFFTDARSRKGADLRANPHAAAVFYWHATRHQVRVEGRVEGVTDAEADAYWRTRPWESRIAASVSRQTAVVASHAELLARWRRLAQRHPRGAVPRPPTWTGYRIVPRAIELWTRGEHRLHHRERFRRTRGGWRRELLQP